MLAPAPFHSSDRSRRPKRPPRSPQVSPRSSQDGPKRTQEGPRGPKMPPKKTPEAPKRAPRGGTRAQISGPSPKEGPRDSQKASKRPPRGAGVGADGTIDRELMQYPGPQTYAMLVRESHALLIDAASRAVNPRHSGQFVNLFSTPLTIVVATSLV